MNQTFKGFYGLLIAGVLSLALMAGCGGGGGGGSTDVPNDTQPTSQRVDVQFGVDNSINVVAGDAPVFSPVQISSDTTGLSVRLVEAPSFVTVDNFNLMVNASALPTVAAQYPLTVAVVNSENSELGRVSGVVDVAKSVQSTAPTTLANSQTVNIDAFNISVQAPDGAFTSGSANLKVEEIADASGVTSYRYTLSEPNKTPLYLSEGGATATAKSLSNAASVRQATTIVSPPEGEVCSSEGDYGDSVAPDCLLAWKAETDTATCRNITANSTPSIIGVKTNSALAASSPQCAPNEEVVHDITSETWSRLSGPLFCPSNGKPVLLIHGYTLGDSMGGGSGTWGSIADLLQGSRLPDLTIPVVYEFQWRTNTRFQEVADDLINAVNYISAQNGNATVTVIAHSFGGLVTRTALQGVSDSFQKLSDKDRKNSVNKFAAKIDRVITLGTPHSGIAGSGYGETENYGRKFPIGTDNLFLNGCGQISCYQAGESEFSHNFIETPGEPEPGYIVAELSNFVIHPWPLNLPVHVLIGLRRSLYSTPNSTPSGTVYSQHNGDGLISYQGQRFFLYDGVNGTSLNNISSTSQVKEKIIGWDGEPKFNTPLNYFPDVGHTHSFGVAYTAEYAEAEIDSDQHPTWLEIKNIFIPQTVNVPPITLDINNGALSTASRTVTLNNSASGSPAYYMASEFSSFIDADWQTYSTAPIFTFVVPLIITALPTQYNSK